MKRLVIGLLAHVDSGKTTLAEGLLYRAGVLRKLGRVDHKDAFLDTDSLERARGITITAYLPLSSSTRWTCPGRMPPCAYGSCVGGSGMAVWISPPRRTPRPWPCAANH